jgi:hypothetical protein
VLASEYSSLPCRERERARERERERRTRTKKSEKAQFKVALRKCLCILFSVDEFLMLKNAS